MKINLEVTTLEKLKHGDIFRVNDKRKDNTSVYMKIDEQDLIHSSPTPTNAFDLNKLKFVFIWNDTLVQHIELKEEKEDEI